MPKPVMIRPEDVERVVGAMPENTSNARSYFRQEKLKNSTHIAASELMRDYGNVPVITRGDTGVVPEHGVSVSDIVPMPIEIDDKISAVHMDELSRATAMGRNQIIDEYLAEHTDMVRNTVNALCCQAHSGKIDYMMKSIGGTSRYVVNYGTVKKITFPKTLATATLGDVVRYLGQLKEAVTKNGIGGPGEFVVAGDVYARFSDLLITANRPDMIKDGYLIVGSFRVLEDNDSYYDLDASGNKISKSLCGVGQIVYRAINGGQKLLYLKLDDVVQREAVPIYSFTVSNEDQRGDKIYTKSKPFPLINTKAIAWGEFKAQQYTATFSVSGSNGTLEATVDGSPISTGAKVTAGSTIVFTAKPSGSYQVDTWSGASAAELTDLGGDKKSIEVSADVTVQVSFKSAG